MKVSRCKSERARRRRAVCSAEARWQRALRALRPGAPEVFSDRQEDAVEYEHILREFGRARDEALGVERFA